MVLRQSELATSRLDWSKLFLVSKHSACRDCSALADIEVVNFFVGEVVVWKACRTTICVALYVCLCCAGNVCIEDNVIGVAVVLAVPRA